MTLLAVRHQYIAALMAVAGAMACTSHGAAAQDMLTAKPASLPFFAWGEPAAPIRWDGNYLRMSSGFSVTSFRKGPTIAGPTIGLDAGRMWQEGQWVYGVSAQLDYMPVMTRITNTAAFPIYTRDFSGTVRAKFGYLVQPNLLLYTSIGATVFNETLRMPANLGGATDTRFAVRPDLRAGATWAVNNNLHLTVEVGVQPPLR
ncbi:MAG: outer membrane protein [Beijerinckiaceae bacterium]